MKKSFEKEMEAALVRTIQACLSEETVAEAATRKPRLPVSDYALATGGDSVHQAKTHMDHDKAKIAYWQDIIKKHRQKGTNADRAIKMLKRAESSHAIWQMHHQRATGGK